MSNRRVLFVDDEPNVVDSMKRLMRKSFDVSTSTDPSNALSLLGTHEDYAVIVSDMRMPQMSGVEFLSAVKQAKPDTVRIMLTGNQDQQTASDAVNQGEVFRFLNKPCNVESLTQILEQAIRQYELITAERDVLERTLHGSVKVLLEALSMAKPEVFGSVDRIERRCAQISDGLTGIESWEMRAAAQLSQIGYISVADDTLKKVKSGVPLSARELEEYRSHPQLGSELIEKIPRMGGVARCIRYQQKNFDGSGLPSEPIHGAGIPLGARILRLVLEFDGLQTRGSSDAQALNAMRGRVGWFDPELTDRFARFFSDTAPTSFRVPPDKLHSGLTIAEDVQSTKGILLVCRGQLVTPAIQRHLRHFHELGTLTDSILVFKSND